MKYRRLRIAFSAACGVLCLLLIALWVRSYGKSDVIVGLGGDGYSWFESSSGFLALGSAPEHLRQPPKPAFGVVTYQIVASENFVIPWRVGYFRSQLGDTWLLPIWMLIAAVVALGTCPWLRWRFSLRTLLIATTIIGLLLGTIIIATTR